MTYTLLYTRSAFSDIQKLDRVVKKKIKKKIEVYSTRPLINAKRLINPKIGTHRWRIGDYRVVFDLNGKNIVILRIGHRREIYR